ncbi:MAG: HAD family hydrolase [Muribaculaceae bacterium]|nr:HAD family hydrolase [Muribaculaceae bacterium]
MSVSVVVSLKRLKMGNIKGIIFDYGGTIDSRGVHWSEIIWEGYQEAQIDVTKEQFRECYVYAERELARTPHILPHHNFYDILLIKMRIELGYLAEQNLINASIIEEKALAVAKYCYESARDCVESARPTIETLYEKYPLVLVSNFYGNVESVLADFNLRHYFKEIVESAVVGIRKPDPRIFMLGVDALGLNPEEVLVIGDSYKKDIVPAETIGCKVAWIKGKGWTADEDAVTHPCIISKLEEVLSVF